MKQLMLVIAISIISVAVFACGPAVGRAVGDAQVDVDATLAEMGEPTTEAEKELYSMMKEIDRLHKEEREDLVGALAESGQVIDQLIYMLETLGDELDPEVIAKIGSVIAGGQDVEAYFQSMREQAYAASAKEREINDLLANEEVATWNRIKFLNEQLDKANAEKADIKEDLDKAHVNLDRADKDEDKWISSNLDKEQDIQVLEARMERASGKFEVVTAMLDQVLGDETDDAADAPSAFEKSSEEAGRYQAAAIFNECLVDWGVEVKETTREEMKHCRHQVLEELDNQGTEVVEIEGGKVISEPNYLATLDRDDVVEVVDAFMHCAQAADAERIIGPAAEGCKMEAKEIHHDAAGNGSSFTDHFADRISGDNADARRTRKFIDVKADAIGDPEFKEKLDKVMYQPGRSKDEVRDAFKGLLNEAKEDLHCDPQGLQAKRCDDFDFHPSLDDQQGDSQRKANNDRRMPIAHKYEERMKKGGGDTYRPSRDGGDHPNLGIGGEVTKEQFDQAFKQGHERNMRDRVKECVDDGNSMQECIGDVRSDMREERDHHQNFNENEFHKQRDSMADHHRQNFENTQGGGQDGMMAQRSDDHQDHFGGIGDGAGKRGHHKMMECMKSATGDGSAQFNTEGNYTGGASFAEAADECMENSSQMMQKSFGNQDMGHHAGLVGTQGMAGAPQQ
ncbi:hypothetical protein OAJ44_02605 [Chloroflexi bacterium]|nr:hypothetical protein [Chloroflexota bacterium]